LKELCSVHRTWRDVEDLARDLLERYPDTDPLTVSLETLRDMIVSLPLFDDKPDAATDETLEEIQAAWYEVSEG
jgi:FeS assembly protein IscX